jgi:glycosyltransferase involved in cell wall biosynthesis
MQIAVNTRFLLPGQMEGFGVYTDEIMQRMTVGNPSDSFTFYFDRKFNTRFRYSDNVHLSSVFPPARHPILFYIWFQMGLRRKLLATRPDVFFSPDSFMPTGMNIPSVITIHDTAYMRFPEYIGQDQLQYYRRYMPKFVREAAHIITVSEFSKKEISRFYDVDPERITVIYNGVSSRFKPVDEATRVRVQNQYSDAKPYFLYVGSIHPRKNIVRLIEAFDLFKLNVDSDLQLVIAGRKSWHFDDVLNAHKKARHGKDIRFIGYIPTDDLPGLVGSAYALTYVSMYEGFGLPVVEAMACGVPVITSSADSTGAVLAEVAGDAAIAVNPASIKAIADGMLRLFDHASLYAYLREEGVSRAKRFSWELAAGQTYRILKDAV